MSSQKLFDKTIKDIFKTGIVLDTTSNAFKDNINKFFGKKFPMMRKFKKIWHEDIDIVLKFDDRLNMFFIFSEWRPILGMYYHEDMKKLFLVPFNSKKLSAATALILAFKNQYQKIDKEREERQKR